MADKQVMEAFVAKVLAAADAADDGVDIGDIDEGVAVLTSLPSVIAEFKKNRTQAALALSGALSYGIHDMREAE